MGGFGWSVHRAHSKSDSATGQGVRSSDLQSQRRRVSGSLCEGKKENMPPTTAPEMHSKSNVAGRMFPREQMRKK